MRAHFAFVCVASVTVAVLHGKEKSDTLHHAAQIEYERALEIASEEQDVGPLVDALSDLHDDPLDLNCATPAELLQLPDLDPVIAQRILARRSAKPFERISDLSDVQGVTPELLRSIGPFVTLNKRSPTAGGGSRFLHIRTRAARSLLSQSASGDSAPPGSPEKLYTKIAARIGGEGALTDARGGQPEYVSPSLLFGFLAEKDPGEQNYLDFMTGHLYATIPSLASRIVLGDYVIDGGQGLVFSRPEGLSKGSDVTASIALKRNGSSAIVLLSINHGSFGGRHWNALAEPSV